jgi:hypothetical protein
MWNMKEAGRVFFFLTISSFHVHGTDGIAFGGLTEIEISER